MSGRGYSLVSWFRLSCPRLPSGAPLLRVVVRAVVARATNPPPLTRRARSSSRTGMVVIGPFVVAVEWLYMSVFNAPVARTRSAAQLALAAEQQQHVWQALARELAAHGGTMHDAAEPPPRGGEGDEELDAWIDAWDGGDGLPPQPRQRDPVRFVVAPVVAHGTSLGVTFTSAAHGHAKVASLAPRSPLVGKLWPGDVVMLLDGESTTQLAPDEVQRRLDDAPEVEHSLLICAEEDEEDDDELRHSLDDRAALTTEGRAAAQPRMILVITEDGDGAPRGEGGGKRIQLVRQPSIAKAFAGANSPLPEAAQAAPAADAPTAPPESPSPSLAAATITAAQTGKRLIYRATFEGGGSLGFSVVDGTPVIVGKVG